MSKRATDVGSGKAGAPGGLDPIPKPITKEFSIGPPPKGPPPAGTPRKMISPIPPPYLYTSGGELPGGYDLGTGSHGSGWSSTVNVCHDEANKILKTSNCLFCVQVTIFAKIKSKFHKTWRCIWVFDLD